MQRNRLLRFTLPTRLDEDNFLFRKDRKQDMACYDTTNVYPFNIFPAKELTELEFGAVTILYGGNGSGKSTLLNVMAEKLGLARRALYNRTPSFDDYLKFCRYEISGGRLPPDSRIITSDDVFDSLLDHRAFNEGVENRREALFEEWDVLRKDGYLMRSMEDIDELSRHNRARSRTRSAYTQDRLRVHELRGASNGESAFRYFIDHIADGSLTLLDEPENSLSAALQERLARHLADSARFYDVQLVIATHSPFMLAIPGATVYDLDSVPACVRPWTELPNVRVWYEFFEAHRSEFE